MFEVTTIRSLPNGPDAPGAGPAQPGVTTRRVGPLGKVLTVAVALFVLAAVVLLAIIAIPVLLVGLVIIATVVLLWLALQLLRAKVVVSRAGRARHDENNLRENVRVRPTDGSA